MDEAAHPSRLALAANKHQQSPPPTTHRSGGQVRECAHHRPPRITRITFRPSAATGDETKSLDDVVSLAGLHG
ncbi:hypothetical protein E2C01_039916 [Portunus trituberculatus]|uniref:Uncharacterized protein n=1 Tax=Portunus trituberculatus TaxID=210409 RepID=A0A5B7FM68_PORTR|nr:hypothetical protein [Portunus trituberculatus]